jgi:putative membrane protein
VIWALPLAVLIGAQIAYPLTHGDARAGLVVATVVLGWAISVGHAALTRGTRTALTLLAASTVGGFLVEAVGLATGIPFGRYEYGQALGPRPLGVPLIVPLAWTWLAWPAWVVAGRLVSRTAARVGVAAVGLAGWDLFLDPQMVAAGYWRWLDPHPALPGVAGVPLGNYVGWFAVALVMMALLATTPPDRGRADAPMYVLYLWTYYSSVLAHAVFLHLPGSALWGGLTMGCVAVPLTVTLIRR